MANNFANQGLLLRVQTDRISQSFLNLIKECKRWFIVPDDELVLLGRKPSTSRWNLFLLSALNRVGIPACYPANIVLKFSVNLTAVPYQYLSVCTNW